MNARHRARRITDRAASYIVRSLHAAAVRVDASREARRRGACPVCGGMLTEHARGVYRCDACRRGDAK